MIGPVLRQEMLVGGRRNRLHVLRWLYAALLVIEVLGVGGNLLWKEITRARQPDVVINPVSWAEVSGADFAELFVRQQIIILLLVTPAFVAGAITEEKRSGTLQYLALTDLESRHIILGKLVARLAQVALVMMAGLPLFAVMAGIGGTAPISMVFVVLVLLMPLFGLSALTLLLSVYCKQTRDAVLGLYLIVFVVGSATYLIGGPLSYFNPYFVLAPVWGPPRSHDLPEAFRRLIVSGVIYGGIGATCAVIAAARMLPAYLKSLESLRPETTWLTSGRDPVPEEPVRWRETQVEGIAPFAGLRRVPQWVAVALIVLATTATSLLVLYLAKDPRASVTDVLRSSLDMNVRKTSELLPGASEGFWWQGLAAMMLASLVVGIRCSGAITLEREKQTWEAVLLTPMTAKQIVRGKLWGVMGATTWYLLAYAAPALALSAFGGPVAIFYTLLWLSVTVLAMYYVGAAGLWCGVRAKDSWRSLIYTLALGYLGGLMLFVVLTPAFGFVMLILYMILWIFDLLLKTGLAGMCWDQHNIRVFFVSACFGLAIAFWLLAAMFVNRTVRWIADRDRTRHWYDEPVYRRSRRSDMPLRSRI